MKKRWPIAWLLLLCLALSACSTGDNKAGTPAADSHLNPQNPVTVSLWHYYVGENQQMLEASIADFNQTVGIEKGVIVEPVALGSIADLEEAITYSSQGVINARPMPQLFSSYPDKALEIDAAGQLVNLADYFTAEEQALFVPDFLQDGIFGEGRMLLTPIVKSTELMYVNATGWNEFAADQGLDASRLSTWESIYETAAAYHAYTAAPGDPWSGKAMMGFDSVANYIIIACKELGVDIIDATAGEAGQAVLDKAKLKRLFDPYFKGISLGYFDAVGRFRSDDIKSGDLISYVGSSSGAAYFPTWIEKDNTQEPIEFLPLSYPTFAGGESYAVQQGAGMCVAKSTPAQEEGSVLFLKWFTSPDVNIRFAMTTGYLPVQTAAYTDPAFESVLEDLRQGDAAQQNVAGVYGISLHQILESNTYAAKPFPGSYSVRAIVQSALMDAAQAGKEAAAPLKEAGRGEADILEALDVNAQFEAWIDAIEKRLTEEGIEYTVS